MSKSKKENEERYVATPKGLVSLALCQSGICDFDDPRIEPFWILFEHYMRNAGYIVDVATKAR